MARLPRFRVLGQPQHVIHRGNNRTPLFASHEDYFRFRETLRASSQRFRCSIHAYVFMTNHIHLLISPNQLDGISRMMQSVGRRYVRYFNDRYQRTGTLWEGRFRATVISTEEYLFTCYRYIEENPVRANIVSRPDEYRWSSFAANALGADDPLVTPHDRYVALDSTPFRRQAAYRGLFRQPIDLSTLASIRDATNHAWALGTKGFTTNRRAARLFKRNSRAGSEQSVIEV